MQLDFNNNKDTKAAAPRSSRYVKAYKNYT